MRSTPRRMAASLAIACTIALAGCSDTRGPTGPDDGEPQEAGAILTGPRSGTARVATFDASGSEVQSYLGYPASYGGGISVALGDLNGDGVDDVVIGASTGRRRRPPARWRATRSSRTSSPSRSRTRAACTSRRVTSTATDGTT